MCLLPGWQRSLLSKKVLLWSSKNIARLGMGWEGGADCSVVADLPLPRKFMLWLVFIPCLLPELDRIPHDNYFTYVHTSYLIISTECDPSLSHFRCDWLSCSMNKPPSFMIISGCSFISLQPALYEGKRKLGRVVVGGIWREVDQFRTCRPTVSVTMLDSFLAHHNHLQWSLGFLYRDGWKHYQT